MRYTGRCLCGAVSFGINSELTDIVYCHCSMCRKLSGSAFLAFGSVGHESIEIKGIDHIATYTASPFAKRQFCSRCGSTLFWQPNGEYGQKYTCVALGTIDNEFHPKTWKHFYTSCKATWYQIQDDMPQCAETS